MVGGGNPPIVSFTSIGRFVSREVRYAGDL
jgi:hypothetical protein